MLDANLVIARQLDSAANIVSGLSLEDIGEDGHAIANRLWRIATHLRNRSRKNVSPDVIRAWARQNGYHIRATARIPREIEQGYYNEVLNPPAADL